VGFWRRSTLLAEGEPETTDVLSAVGATEDAPLAFLSPPLSPDFLRRLVELVKAESLRLQELTSL
jgi:hypothetical protein